MSEENNTNQESVETEAVESEVRSEDKNAKLKSLPAEDLVQIVLDLRAENAKRRTSDKEKDAELAEFQRWKDSQKTEAEKLKEENALLKKQLSGRDKEKMKDEVGKEVELDPDLWEFIKGDTKEDMLASANKLAGKAGPRKVTSSDVFGGRRGAPVGDKPGDVKEQANDYLRQLIFGQ